MSGRGAILTTVLLAVACGGEAPPLAVNAGTAIPEAYATASPAPDVSALYFTVANDGADADTMLAVATSAGEATLHAVEIRDGLSSMVEVERLAIPAGGMVRMRPGGYHVMLSGLPSPLRAGDTIDVEATFARAGTLRFRAAVLAYSDLVERLERAEARGP